MRYIQIPKSETVVQADGTTKAFTFDQFLAQVVWVHECWRSDSEGTGMHDTFCSLTEKFAGALAGEWVELTDAEYEKFRPIATMRGEKMAPGMAIPLNAIMRPVIAAPKEKPAETVKAPEAVPDPPGNAAKEGEAKAS